LKPPGGTHIGSGPPVDPPLLPSDTLTAPVVSPVVESDDVDVLGSTWPVEPVPEAVTLSLELDPPVALSLAVDVVACESLTDCPPSVGAVADAESDALLVLVEACPSVTPAVALVELPLAELLSPPLSPHPAITSAAEATHSALRPIRAPPGLPRGPRRGGLSSRSRARPAAPSRQSEARDEQQPPVRLVVVGLRAPAALVAAAEAPTPKHALRRPDHRGRPRLARTCRRRSGR
jgi:hypothetical protein